jgi:hypothetical protein
MFIEHNYCNWRPITTINIQETLHSSNKHYCSYYSVQSSHLTYHSIPCKLGFKPIVQLSTNLKVSRTVRSLKFSSSTFCPHGVFVCFVWIWEQTAIISLYSINSLVSSQRLHPLKPSGHYNYRQFNIQQFYVLPTQCIYAFCVDLRTNSININKQN